MKCLSFTRINQLIMNRKIITLCYDNLSKHKYCKWEKCRGFKCLKLVVHMVSATLQEIKLPDGHVWLLRCKILGSRNHVVKVSLLLGFYVTSHCTFLPLKMRPLRCVETSGNKHPATYCYTPEGWKPELRYLSASPVITDHRRLLWRLLVGACVNNRWTVPSQWDYWI
jgi:hypothetical protein